MKIRVICLIILGLCALTLAGCASSSGAFATTEERASNLGESVANVFLDGDGVN